MHSRDRTPRRARGVTVLAYVAMLVAGPMVDAALEMAAFDQTTHVEADSRGHCFVAHSEAMCQLCRLLEIPGFPFARPLLPDLGSPIPVGIFNPAWITSTRLILARAPARGPPHPAQLTS